MQTVSTTDTLSTRLADALRLIDEACADAAKRLEGQPDNPAIQRVDSSKTSFVIKLSELNKTKSWDAFRHDWVAQYEYARDLIEKRRFSTLRTMLAGGGYRDPSHGWRAFAPDVVENIKRITGDLQAAVAMTDATRPDTTETKLPEGEVDPSGRAPKMKK